MPQKMKFLFHVFSIPLITANVSKKKDDTDIDKISDALFNIQNIFNAASEVCLLAIE